MNLSIISFKGGVGKTTTSIHLAALLQNKAPTTLIDGDPNRSALSWAERGKLPFQVIQEDEFSATTDRSKHTIIDTAARPTEAELRSLASFSDLLIIPTTADALSLDALMLIAGTLQSLDITNFWCLLTIVPPRSNAGRDAKTLLEANDLKCFKTEIHRRAAFTKAALLGTTVNKIKDNKALEAWEEYKSLGKEIISK